MSIVEESDILFDFSHALSVSKHDAQNRVWPGVDFILEEESRHIWLEIKNWEPSTLPPRLRGGKRRQFLARIRGSLFFNELREKFLGTSTFLTLTGNHPQTPIRFVVLLESPRLDSAMKTRAIEQMRSRLPSIVRRHVPWTIPIAVVVMDMDDWNHYFPDYPARRM